MFFAVSTSAWPAVLLTIKLAFVTTLFLVVIGLPLSWWLARSRSRWRVVVEAIVALPLVLPPTVLGFYLLVALAPSGAVGSLWESLGGNRLVFSFSGLVVGSICYSIPFMVQPITSAFRALGDRPFEVAASLGAGPWDRFFRLAIPMSKRAILTGCVLAFAHTMGEFGVVLMIGGNVAGVTDVLSITIYEHVETQDYAGAHLISGALLLASFVALLVILKFSERKRTPST
ncbi:MAG: molybdate transport system permease protein [Planctomycetota bacterium]|jgi:molybdate transport system permease protein